ncbi:thermonuclease family protein [Aromatoleum aromaticum]|uniref:thermonuclease family protein n=1 Tax=Aromatoleum aromaticum TaxID=551760 RepID=UPI0021125121|nr:thermonuclease family protein [Aromatoleum aromaticum]
MRLSGIDAPERRQAFGDRSRQNLAGLVFRKYLVVEWDKVDRYKRIIGKVILDGKDVNLSQITAGYAGHYKEYQREQPFADRQSYARAEGEARTRRLGLWLDAVPVAPWDFRRNRH